MKKGLSSEAEEYLEAIYKLQRWKGIAKTTELAGQLNVVPGSVTNTIRHLKEHKLVKHEPYQGVKLTKKGEKIALQVLRRHRLAERLLTDLLGVNWSDSHANACELEHAISSDVTSLLDKKLGYPKFCPHGNPIPSFDGGVKYEECIPLDKAKTKKVYTVSRIINEDSKKLAILSPKGITPGVTVQVLRKKPRKLILDVDGIRQNLGYDTASDVCVKKKEIK